MYWSQQPPSVLGPGILTFHLAFALGSLPVPVSQLDTTLIRGHTLPETGLNTQSVLGSEPQPGTLPQFIHGPLTGHGPTLNPSDLVANLSSHAAAL